MLLTKAEGQPIGVELAQGEADHALEVLAVKEDGAVSEWNKSNPEHAIEEYDVMVQVNSVSGTSKDLMKEMKDATTVALKLERHHSAAEESKVELKREKDEKMGLKLEPGHQGRLRIIDIGEGLVEKHNASASTLRTIEIGDYIIEVNGIKGRDMSKKMTSEDTLTLTIQHTDHDL